ncbi:MAG: hypothetical protein IID30_07715 [Planctomycetes bacterium]|nr:hypothetical protein [Planctomycetota bacterium]
MTTLGVHSSITHSQNINTRLAHDLAGPHFVCICRADFLGQFRQSPESMALKFPQHHLPLDGMKLPHALKVFKIPGGRDHPGQFEDGDSRLPGDVGCRAQISCDRNYYCFVVEDSSVLSPGFRPGGSSN